MAPLSFVLVLLLAASLVVPQAQAVPVTSHAFVPNDAVDVGSTESQAVHPRAFKAFMSKLVNVFNPKKSKQVKQGPAPATSALHSAVDTSRTQASVMNQNAPRLGIAPASTTPPIGESDSEGEAAPPPTGRTQLAPLAPNPARPAKAGTS